MGRLFSLVAMLSFAALVSIGATADAVASACVVGVEQQISPPPAPSIELIADSHHRDGHEHDPSECCWDSLCFDPTHCHHATAPGLLPTVNVTAAVLLGHGVYHAGVTPQLRPGIPQIDLDPPIG